MSRGLIDITGQRFGMLVAIEHIQKDKWLCKCDCGNTCIAYSSKMRAGRKKTCGCVKIARNEYKGCDEDCFNCVYSDCLKPDYKCRGSIEHGEKLRRVQRRDVAE